MIYTVPNFITKEITYICPDQATINDGIAKGFIGQFIIGTQNDANILLENNKQAYLPNVLPLFTVAKDINPDPIDTSWVACDLDLEPENNNVDYNIFDVVNGYYLLATGLANAKTLLEETKQSYLNWAMTIGFSETWPTRKKPKSTGTQNF